MDGGLVSVPSWGAGATGLRHVSASRLAAGKWGDRKCDSAGDQPAAKREQHFLAGGKCGGDAGTTWSGVKWSLERDVRADHPKHRRRSPHGLELEISRHARGIEGGHHDRTANAATPNGSGMLRHSCLTTF